MKQEIRVRRETILTIPCAVGALLAVEAVILTAVDGSWAELPSLLGGIAAAMGLLAIACYVGLVRKRSQYRE